jgi:hypothetical protein
VPNPYWATTVVDSADVLSARSPSASAARTEATFEIVPASDGLTTIATVLPPVAIVPRSQVTVPSRRPLPARAQLPWLGVAETKTASGRTSVA